MITLNYNVPITESVGEGESSFIEGTAIRATITSNGHEFPDEELKKSAKTLTEVPLLKNHENRIESIVGRVKKGWYEDKSVRFKAEVIDETAKQLIKDKRLNSVSVGVDVKHIERVGEGDDSRLVLTGLKFRELSLVAVGADEGANFEMAVTEAYNIQQKKTEGLNMSNDETKLAEEARKAEEAKKAESARLAEEAKAAEAKKTNDLAIKETNDRLKIAEEKIKAYEAKERKTLEENYAKLCEKKGAKALDVKEMESKMIETLMKQIETVTETESSDETENEIKVGEKFKVVQCAGSLNGGAFTLERC